MERARLPESFAGARAARGYRHSPVAGGLFLRDVGGGGARAAKGPGGKAAGAGLRTQLVREPFFLQWFFQAFDRMHWVATASIQVRQTVFAGFLFFCVGSQTPLFVIGLVECLSVTGVAAFCVYVVHWRMGFALPWPILRWRALRLHLREATPIGLTELAWAFMWYFGTVLLGLISTQILRSAGLGPLTAR